MNLYLPPSSQLDWLGTMAVFSLRNSQVMINCGISEFDTRIPLHNRWASRSESLPISPTNRSAIQPYACAENA